MMKSTQQPLAHLVDAAAENWLRAESLPVAARLQVELDISRRFNPGERDELTFHGMHYQLTIERCRPREDVPDEYIISVHRIAQ